MRSLLHTKREERFSATLLCSKPGNLHDFLQAHVCPPAWGGRQRKDAVSAGISAQPRQGQKHLPHRPPVDPLSTKHQPRGL